MKLTTGADVIAYEIAPALGEYVNDFDLAAIVDEVYTYDAHDGYKKRDDIDFWDVVSKHDISETI